MQKQTLTENLVPCGCGRSQSGYCVGLHNLTEEQYKQKVEFDLQEGIAQQISKAKKQLGL